MSAPLTGFESRGTGAWTTLVEEAAFWDALSAVAGPRVRVTDAGVNGAGKALRYIEVGYPAAVSPTESAVLLVAQQHGEEAAGREALFQLIRDWSTTSDAGMQAYMARTRIVCVTTANPDGLPIPALQGGSYHNAADVNINRDHLRVTQPEAQLIQRLISQFRPDVVVDSHENGSPSQMRCAFTGSTHPTVDPRLRAEGVSLVQALIPRIVAMGYVGSEFVGTSDADALRQVAGLRNAVGVLFETDMMAGQQLARVAMQIEAFSGVIAYHRAHYARIRALCDAAAVRGKVRAAYPGTAFAWGNGNAGPCPTHYAVTGPQRTANAALWTAYGLPEVSPSSGGSVSIAGHFPVLPFLLDSRAAGTNSIASTPVVGSGADLRLINPGTGWEPCTAHSWADGAWQ